MAAKPPSPGTLNFTEVLFKPVARQQRQPQAIVEALPDIQQLFCSNFSGCPQSVLDVRNPSKMRGARPSDRSWPRSTSHARIRDATPACVDPLDPMQTTLERAHVDIMTERLEFRQQFHQRGARLDLQAPPPDAVRWATPPLS